MLTKNENALNEARIVPHEALQRYPDTCVELENQPFVSPVETRLTSDELSTTNAGQYQNTIQQAKASLYRATKRNCLPPVNRLPREVLAHIFTSIQTCYLSELWATHRLHLHCTRLYPLALSQICSRWRNIAISLCDLWSHIDIMPSHPRSHDIALYAQYLAFRAKPATLAVHIEDQQAWEHPTEGGDSLAHFATSFGDRVWSFELRCFYEKPENRRSLSIFLANASVGTLKRLVLINKDVDCNKCYFIAPIGSDITDSAIGQYTLQELQVTIQEFEALLLPLTRLRLCALYLYWTSQAYHGLTELYLLEGQSFDAGHARNTIISDTQLANILHASPELEVFHFGLSVQTTPETAPNPAYMKCLKEFRLEYMDMDQQQAILQLIHPGQRQLHMMCGVEIHFGTLPLTDESQFSRFFLRSHITRLSIKGIMSEFHIFKLLALLPQLRFLALAQFIINIHGELEGPQCASPFQLERLHFLRCDIYPRSLQLLAEVVSIQRLSSSCCQYDLDDLTHIGSSVEQIDSEGGFGEGGWDELL